MTFQNLMKLKNPNSEEAHQMVVKQWIDFNYPDLCWTGMPGGMRVNIGTAMKMKRMGGNFTNEP